MKNRDCHPSDNRANSLPLSLQDNDSGASLSHVGTGELYLRSDLRSSQTTPGFSRKFALPNHDCTPPEPLQFTLNFCIPSDITLELCRPEFDVRLGCRRDFAERMTMPNTSMYEDNSPISRQNDVRSPWKPRATQPIAETETVKRFPERKLGLRVPGSYPRHAFRPLLGTQEIRHLYSRRLKSENGHHSARFPEGFTKLIAETTVRVTALKRAVHCFTDTTTCNK